MGLNNNPSQPAYLIPGLPSAMGNYKIVTTDSAGNLAAGALTAGYVPFGSATGAFGSSSNLFWDNANIRLGIGTSTPSSTFEIISTANTRAINIYNNVATTALGQIVVDAAAVTTGGGLWVGTSSASFSNTTTGLAYFATLNSAATGNVVQITNSGDGYGLRMLTGKNSPLIYLDATAITTSYGIQGAFGGLTTGAAINLSCNNASFSGNGVINSAVTNSSATGSAIYGVQSGSGAAGRFDSSKGYGIDIQSTSTTTPGMRIFMTNQNNNECLQIFSYNAPTGSGKALTIYNTPSFTLTAWISPAGRAFFADNVYGVAGTTTMTDGFFYIPSANGVPTGVPTALTGRVAMYYNTSTNDFYVYNAGWKKVNLA